MNWQGYSGDDILSLADRLHQQGRLLHQRGQLIEAEKILKQSLFQYEMVNYFLQAPVHYDLAEVYFDQVKYDEAFHHYASALQIWKNQKKCHPYMANALNNLGLICQCKCDYFESEEYYIEAVETYKETLGLNNPNSATCLINFAKLNIQTGNYTNAEKLLRQALSSCENNKDKVSMMVIGMGYRNLAHVSAMQYRYVEAEKFEIKGLSIRERILGRNHVEYAESLDCLALLYQTLERYEEAEQCHMQALSIFERGNWRSDIAKCLNNIGLLYFKKKQFELSEQYFIRAIKIKEEGGTQTHLSLATSLLNLSCVYISQKKFKEAEKQLKRSLSIKESVLRQDNPQLANVYLSMGEFYLFVGNYDIAESYTNKAVKTALTLGSDSNDYIASTYQLSRILASKKRFYEAFDLCHLLRLSLFNPQILL